MSWPFVTAAKTEPDTVAIANTEVISKFFFILFSSFFVLQ
ncbi:putative membrane protein [Escherichia coli p0305293.8]|nr:putative membrane protein [Escherichia coli 2749250]EMW72911.1 putative membrane protein [Escherichia coli 2747800]EMX68166.1 putative membrane protein [Escherichia coli Envira 8/11]EMZ82328.1 putative membrane protein [Escherichia coli p0305293.1]ENB05658.1 putative membrane protein [Escherichia coli 2866350]ENG28769.1 putative membrane protein [Escherichia coli p0305293.10]ENG40076.1 putative membrane protein [Escherichia coli p0305293.11]ENG41225.1 putative membrane protein [Escherichi